MVECSGYAGKLMASALSSDWYKYDCENVFTGLDMPGRSEVFTMWQTKWHRNLAGAVFTMWQTKFTPGEVCNDPAA